MKQYGRAMIDAVQGWSAEREAEGGIKCLILRGNGRRDVA